MATWIGAKELRSCLAACGRKNDGERVRGGVGRSNGRRTIDVRTEGRVEQEGQVGQVGEIGEGGHEWLPARGILQTLVALNYGDPCASTWSISGGGPTQRSGCLAQPWPLLIE